MTALLFCAALASAQSPAPSRARYQYLLANYLLAKGDTAGAVAAADVALLHDPHAVAPRLLKAKVAKEDGRSDDALMILEEAAKKAPDSAEAWTALAAMRAARGDTYGAASAQAKAASLAGASPLGNGG